MTLKHSGILSLAVALVLVPGLASAQTAPANYLTVSSTPSGISYAPGSTDAVLGTIVLSAAQPGTYQIASLPLTLTTTGSGTASDLSSCQLINSNGSPLNTNGNLLNSVSAGNNTLTFDTPLTVTNGSPVTLTERCNISSNTPVNSTFSFAAGSPSFAPSLAVAMTVLPSVTPGEINAPIAAITLDPSASSSNLNITSIPLMVTYLDGLTSSDLSNCRLTLNGSTLDVGGTGVLNAGSNTLNFDTTLSAVPANGALPIMLNCSVASSAPIGSDISLSLDPADIAVTNANRGTAITAVQGSDPSTGAADTLGGITTVVSPTGTVTTTVTAPDTGAGGSAPLSLALLIGSALLALLGIGYLVRTLRRA